MTSPLTIRNERSTDSDTHSTALFRRAASFIPTGVAIVSNGEITMTVSSLQCVSFNPPMLSLALSKHSEKGAAILSGRRFRAHLLRHGEEDLARTGTMPSGPGILEMDCTVAAIYPAGDHRLVLAKIGQASTSQGFPIVYWRRGLHPFRPHYDFLSSRNVFRDFVDRWETATLPKNQWTHAAHVAIGAYYAIQSPGTAFERTRNGILRYNEAVGTVNSDCSGYHETLTRLWSIVLAKFTEGFSDSWEAARHAVAQLGEDRDLHCLYYSFDVVRSADARRMWIAPDLDGPN